MAALKGEEVPALILPYSRMILARPTQPSRHPAGPAHALIFKIFVYAKYLLHYFYGKIDHFTMNIFGSKSGH